MIMKTKLFLSFKKKAQVATELLVFIAVFLVIFLISLSFYFSNVQKVTENVAMQEANIVQDKISRAISLAVINPGTNVSLLLPTKLGGEINYVLNISRDTTGTNRIIIVDIIEQNNQISYRKSINLSSTNVLNIKLGSLLTNQNLTIDPLQKPKLTIETKIVGTQFDIEIYN